MVHVKVDRTRLLDYAKAGKEAVRKIRKAMYRIMNAGRKESRQRISAKFASRTGGLRRRARRMRSKVDVKSYEIKGRVKPLPRLLNIFEGGATLSQGRGFIQPRPVVGPGQQAIDKTAVKELNAVMSGIGK